MKKYLFLALVATLMLVSCAPKSQDPAPVPQDTLQVETIDTPATAPDTLEVI